MDYGIDFRKMCKKYLEARMEYKLATSMATKELKGLVGYVTKYKAQIDRDFEKKGWACVWDKVSGLYVCRIRSVTLAPLTEESMAELVEKAEALQQAKGALWNTVDEFKEEVCNLVNSYRQIVKYSIKICKKPRDGVQVINLQDVKAGEKYEKWLHAFVANSDSLNQKKASITHRKSKIKARYEEHDAKIAKVFSQNRYVSVPFKFARTYSPEFVDVVTMTGSNYMSQNLPRKTKRLLEYLPKTTRNTKVKKFSISKKILNQNISTFLEGRDFRQIPAHKLLAHIFKQLRQETIRKNEEKIRNAREKPIYQLRVSKKRTMSKMSKSYQPHQTYKAKRKR